MTSSDSDYKLRIPKHVAQKIETLLPYGLADDVLAQLLRLESNPGDGALGPGGLTRFYVFKVKRPPIVLSVIVTYAILEEQRFVLLQRVALDDGDESEG